MDRVSRSVPHSSKWLPPLDPFWMVDPLLFASDPDSCIMTQKPFIYLFFFGFSNSIFSYSHLQRSSLTPELLMSLTAIKSLGSLAGGLQHTGGTLYASRHHTHPLMADRTAEKGAQPSTLPKGFPRKPGSSAEAPGTPRSPGRRRRQLHASPRRRRRRRCPSPAARRPLGAKFRGLRSTRDRGDPQQVFLP